MSQNQEKKDDDRVTILVKKIRTRNQLLLQEASRPAFGEHEGPPGGQPVPYPNVLSVSHSNIWQIPKGIGALRDTPALYIESETDLDDGGYSRFYNIVDAFGRYLYVAQELSRHRGSSRPFKLRLIDDLSQHFLTISRPGTWGLCCLGSKCKGNNVTVSDHYGTQIGQIRQVYREGLKYRILDSGGDEIMRIKGPAHVSLLHPKIGKRQAVELYFVNRDNKMENQDDYVVGTFNVITQETKTSGFVFGMQFPLDFTPEYKALVMAAGFLLNFTFCEIRPSKCLNWYGSGLVLSIIIVLFVLTSITGVLLLTVVFQMIKF